KKTRDNNLDNQNKKRRIVWSPDKKFPADPFSGDKKYGKQDKNPRAGGRRKEKKGRSSQNEKKNDGIKTRR
ncbi:MAG: hypothetical protein KKB53_05655, partial [Acidobacteria bacterium]|nr:hypothetical protein [Acidobacteriota bacterium]